MTSYSDNGYDVTNYFCCFEKFMAYTLFLPGLIVVRRQMAELDLEGGGGGFSVPVHYMGIPDFVQNRVKSSNILITSDLNK